MTTQRDECRPIVLLIENDPILMMTLSDLIEDAGCDVVEATTTAATHSAVSVYDGGHAFCKLPLRENFHARYANAGGSP